MIKIHEICTKYKPETYLKDRVGGIGASEIATVLGKNPYVQEKPVEGLKSQRKFKGNFFTQWGQRYEPVAIKWLESKFGKFYQCGSVPHHTLPVRATPDSLSIISFGTKNLLTTWEIKCPIKMYHEVPIHYQMQCQTQAACVGADCAMFVACNFKKSKKFVPSECSGWWDAGGFNISEEDFGSKYYFYLNDYIIREIPIDKTFLERNKDQIVSTYKKVFV